MRLVTRGDMDGLACAVLITTCETIEEVLLVHPQDITDQRLAITDEDILANLPYHHGCAKWFDHHQLTESNQRPPETFDGRYGLAPSAARMVYEYYLAKNQSLQRYDRLVAEADRLDSAQLNLEDVLDPKDYILRGYTLDPRTGLGSYHDYFLELVDWIKSKPIGDILSLPEVQQRVTRIREQDARFREVTTAKS